MSTYDHQATENARLRAEVDEWRAKERQRDVQAALDRQAAEQAARTAEAERLNAEANAARAAEVEATRKRAWVNFNTDAALAGGEESFRAYLGTDINARIPTAGWPPGMEPTTDDDVVVDENEAAVDSPLTAALAKHGMKLR